MIFPIPNSNNKKKKKTLKCQKIIIVLPAGTIQLSNAQGEQNTLHTLTSPGGGTLVQYTQGQDGQPIFVPGKFVCLPITWVNFLNEPESENSRMFLFDLKVYQAFKFLPNVFVGFL